MHELTSSRRVYLTAAFFSIFLSIWSAIKETVINTDAICYLQSAESMNLGLSAAMHLCGQAQWPFFSMLIYGLSQVFHNSSLVSAYVLNGVFSLISVMMFIRIIQFFKPSLRVLWLAAIVILLAHEFNAVRVYIVRDHGFWALYLTSLVLLLHYFRRPQWCLALGWSVSLLVATLFRIEGLIFLLLLPFVAVFDQQQSWLRRFKQFLQLNTLLIVLGVLAVGITLLQSEAELGRVDEVKFQLLNGVHTVLENFNTKSEALGEHVLSVFSKGDAKLVLFLTLITWYVFSVIANLSAVYAVLIVYAWCKRLLSNKVLWAYIFVNVVITSMFLVENMFLSKRYLLALSLVLMAWVPFALEDLWQQWSRRKWPLLVTAFFIFVTSLGGIFDFGYSKAYIRQAGEWLEQNVSAEAKLYSNDYQVMYYSRHFGNDIFTQARIFVQPESLKNWQQYDYVAIRSSYKNLNTEITATPVQVFKNKRGDQVSIYKISH